MLFVVDQVLLTESALLFNHMTSVYLTSLQADFTRFEAQLQSSLVVTELFEEFTTK